MATRRKPTVVDRDGVRARIREFVVDDTHTVAVIVELSNHAHLRLPAAVLRHAPDGGFAIAARWRELVHEDHDRYEIPVIAEHVTVDVRKRLREAVRVRRSIVREDRLVETPLTEERLEVDRVPVDTVSDSLPQPRREADLLVIPVVEEEVVVVRRYRVREELRIRVVRDQRIDRQTITLRRHEISIERSADHQSQQPPKSPEGDRS